MAALEGLLGEHRDAVAHFVNRARAVPADRWLVPRAEGKWSPAEETRHIILSYQAIIADLRDGRTMAPRTHGVRRFIARALGLSSILYLRRIPKAVRAPREVRPPEERGTCEDLLAELERVVGECEGVFADAWRQTPARTLSHPFFGAISLRQSMTMAVVHTRHHAAFLPANEAM